MDLIGSYGEEDAPTSRRLEELSSAPDVHVTETDLEQAGTRSLVPAAAARSIGYNVARSIMHAPVVGPANPADLSRGVLSGGRNHWSGHAQDAHLSSFAFEEQYHTFAKTGNAVDPGNGRSAGRGHAAQSEPQPGRPKEPKRQKVSESARPSTGIALDRPFVLKTRQPWAEKDVATVEEDLTEEQQKYIESLKMDKDAKKSLVSSEDVSIFHGAAGEDYQGRSWIDEPAGLRAERGESCFVPKRLVHTWTGHSKGVNAIRFFPQTGHLLLSAGLDGTAKIWTTAGSRECMRTYIGHTKGIRDCYFAEQGRKFVTAAYDKAIKLWDTESGNMLQKFDAKNATAFSVRTHPAHPDIVLAGMSNKKILQFDARSGDTVQEYDYHLDAVNTITFFDGGRKFISTSDDKTIRVWEFGVPVQTQCIQDPSLHAISSASLTCNENYLLGQSANNQVVSYSLGNAVRQNRKKTFAGHVSAGYACQVGVSHDDKFVFSGDGDGKVFIWSWKSKKIVRSIKAHDGVCIGCEWHPLDTSKLATCGWDGLIKYWD